MTGIIEARLKELGHGMPEPTAPGGSYIPVVRTGSLAYLSGQVSRGTIGTLGAGLSVAQGQAAAAEVALMLLAMLDKLVDGEVGRIRRVVRLGVFVASAPGFTDQSKVGNGASDLIVAVLGDAGRHARTAIGVAALPLGVAVEIDAVVELEPE